MILINEEEVKFNLSKWLKRFVPSIEIRWEKRNDYGFATFTCKGSRRKPDLIFWIPKNNFRYLLSAVEVKNGDHSFDLIDSVKIVDYYELTKNGELRYFVDGNELVPKYFLVATQYFPEGYLSKRDSFHMPLRKKNGIDYTWQPDVEYPICFQFVRQLWRQWKDKKDVKFRLGILLSDKLNGGTGCPAIFVQKFNWKKRKWNPPHYFWKLGDRF